MQLSLLSNDCYPNKTCPAVYDTDTDDLLVQGRQVTDPAALAALEVPEHETVALVPRSVVYEAARRLGWLP